MNEPKDLQAILQALCPDEPLIDVADFKKYGEVADLIVKRAESIIAINDDHLALNFDLPDSFLASPLTLSTEEKYPNAVAMVLEQGSIVADILNRPVSEDN